MTRKLYYEDAYLFSFSATINSIVIIEGKSAVILDSTAFFPEGGGQPGDTGIIGSVPVTDTKIFNGDILHFIVDASQLTEGDRVECSVDKEKRFARMQAHTGEHIVSGIAHRLFGAENVGFHMDENAVMTVDFDRFVSKEDLAEVEKQANICVYNNVPVKAWFPSPDELKTMEYRSKIDDFDDMRIVEIEGYDACACCAPHLRSSGEAGLIKILTSAKHRGGVRLTLVCGITAYEDYVIKYGNTMKIADLLCAKHNETFFAVEKLVEKERELKYRLAEKTNALIEYVYNSVVFCEGNLVICLDALDVEELKQAALKLKGRCKGICIVVSGDDRKGYYFAAASDSVKIIDFTKNITTSLKGSGGGRYDVIQGRLGSSFYEIKEFFNDLTVK